MFYALTSSRRSNWPPLTSNISDSDHLEVLAANLSNGAGFLFHSAGELGGFFADHWNRGQNGGPLLITEGKDRLQDSLSASRSVSQQEVSLTVNRRRGLWDLCLWVRLESVSCSQLARKRLGFQIPVSNRGGRGVWTNQYEGGQGNGVLCWLTGRRLGLQLRLMPPAKCVWHYFT
jgi:hypothetical protein